MIKFLDVIDVFYLKVQFSWILLYWSIVRKPTVLSLILFIKNAI